MLKKESDTNSEIRTWNETKILIVKSQSERESDTDREKESERESELPGDLRKSFSVFVPEVGDLASDRTGQGNVTLVLWDVLYLLLTYLQISWKILLLHCVDIVDVYIADIVDIYIVHIVDIYFVDIGNKRSLSARKWMSRFSANSKLVVILNFNCTP